MGEVPLFPYPSPSFFLKTQNRRRGHRAIPRLRPKSQIPGTRRHPQTLFLAADPGLAGVFVRIEAKQYPGTK